MNESDDILIQGSGGDRVQSVLSQLSYHVDVELEAEFIILSCLARSLSLSLHPIPDHLGQQQSTAPAWFARSVKRYAFLATIPLLPAKPILLTRKSPNSPQQIPSRPRLPRHGQSARTSFCHRRRLQDHRRMQKRRNVWTVRRRCSRRGGPGVTSARIRKVSRPT